MSEFTMTAIDFKTPPLPTNAAEWANHIAAYSVAMGVEMARQGGAMNRAAAIAQDAVAIFVDRTTVSSSAATSETRMAEAVALAKLARTLAES